MAAEDPKRTRAECLLSLVGQLRGLTVRLAADATDISRQRTYEHGQLQKEWEQTFVEILRELVRATRPPALGDRHADKARRHLVERFIGFAQAILQARGR